MISHTRILFCTSLLALASGCVATPEDNNQSAAPANAQAPSDNGVTQTAPSGPSSEAQTQLNERRGENIPPVPTKAGSRDDVAPTARQRNPESPPQRNEASSRPAPRPAPAPAPTETCAPEHRAAGHC